MALNLNFIHLQSNNYIQNIIWHLSLLYHELSFGSIQAAASIKDGKRILFQFDRAAFSFKFLPFKLPYPVPFRLLGDEAKGWLDTTYLSPSGDLRISRGNKVNGHFVCSLILLLQYLCSGKNPGQNLLFDLINAKDIQ